MNLHTEFLLLHEFTDVVSYDSRVNHSDEEFANNIREFGDEAQLS